MISSTNLSDGATLVSNDGSFELDFFSSGSSTKSRYLGIWLKKISVQTVVWVANRCDPINDTSGVSMINSTGNLDRIAGKSETLLWQSFDYPTNSWLPGMKLGWDLRTDLNRRLSAWKSPDDPCPGDLTLGIERYNYPDLVMWKGSNKYFRAGGRDGIGVTGLSLPGQISTLRSIRLQRTIWNEEARTWVVYSQLPTDDCDNYGMCAAYETCLDTLMPPCQCLKGFKPKSQEWNSVDLSSQVCVRNNALDCQKGDGFIKLEGLKLPDTEHSWVNRSMDLKECRAKCLGDCPCMAYTTLDVKENRGCAIWFGELLDLKKVQFARQHLYIRMSAADSDHEETKGKTKMKLGLILARRENSRSDERQNEDMELPVFELDAISKATNNFSLSNKLGQGGFGPVYKGTLPDGKQIAVKRLSRSSGQGLVEFKNEVALIVQLQHRNLVKLLGCCVEEKMLIYEYLPNKSLDFFIFDDRRRRLLDWPRHFHIICGIARGLVYLHQDSRLRTIHRDLKASNVLLDSEMNPKISDFDMARTFGEHSEGSTERVVGT
ncbi:hypothetical protein SLEP1_g58179 [Rubroshorea leprosula]|uniref:non-specific serine/threonine protein kinase n=1 Tax=Rubroshorea leprosula TaxID=152421 RepID=A0AAV5MRA6_9ROSI|nr:hypothetical protein SLEP1_g58179 [Rubroshorea leprosula]